MAADAAVSAAVVVAGLTITITGAEWIDPAMSRVIVAVIPWGTLGLLRESVWMSLAGVPKGIRIEEVEAELAALPGVNAVHDLHVWPMSTTENAVTAHLVAPNVQSTDDLLAEARARLAERFRLEHSTIQVERRRIDDCRTC